MNETSSLITYLQHIPHTFSQPESPLLSLMNPDKLMACIETDRRCIKPAILNYPYRSADKKNG